MPYGGPSTKRSGSIGEVEPKASQEERDEPLARMKTGAPLLVRARARTGQIRKCISERVRISVFVSVSMQRVS